MFSLTALISLENFKNTDNIAVIGNININLNQTTNIINEYFNIMLSLGFISYTNKPTRIYNNSKTHIDNIFYKNSTFDTENINGTIIKTNITNQFFTGLHILRYTGTSQTLFPITTVQEK